MCLFLLDQNNTKGATEAIKNASNIKPVVPEVPHGGNSSNMSDLVNMFNQKGVSPKNYEININGTIYKAAPTLSQSAPVIKGVSDEGIFDYYKQLIGKSEMPTPNINGDKISFSLKLDDGTSLTLRNFSSSNVGKWTLEVAKNPEVKQKKTVEIKFE